MCLTRSTILRAPLFYNEKRNISTATINITFARPGWLGEGDSARGEHDMNFFFDISANAMKNQNFLGNFSGKYLMWSVSVH